MSDNLPAHLDANLPTNIESLTDKELIALFGGSQNEGIDLPSLRVNYDDEDNDGNEIPRGQWAITLKGVTVYSKTVSFRVFMPRNQYSHYDRDANELVSKSVLFQNFRDPEIYSTCGRMKCGKLSKKDFENLDTGEKEIQKQIKAAKVLFGLITITGVDAHKNEHTFENEPAMFFARGTNFMPIADKLQELEKKHIFYPRVWLDFSLQRKKNDGVTYWEVVPEVGTQADISPTDFGLLRDFSETIKLENESVFNKYNRNKNKVRDANAASFDGEANELDPLNDLNDDLPEDMNPLDAG